MNDRSIAPILPLLIIGAVVLAYVAVRSVLVSFTWDESWTFMHHVLPGDLYPAEHGLMSGNHHLLNVWGMWVFGELFGQSELALRMPNLFALVVYTLAASRIAIRSGRTLRSVTAFVLLVAHPYLLEFFGLARGYGLSIGFMLMSVWHMVRWAEDPGQPRHAPLMVLFAALSVLSHYIMLNFMAAVATLFVVRMARMHDAHVRWRALRLPLLISTVGLAFVGPQVVGIVHGGGLIWGCDEFWSCSVGGLLLRLAGVQFDTSLIGPLLLLGAFFLVEAALQRWDEEHRATASVAVVTLLCAVFIAGEHFLLGMDWPRTRTVLYLLPLLMAVVVLWLQANAINWPWLWWPAAVAACALGANFMFRADFQRSAEWPEAAEVGRMIELVLTDHAQRSTNHRAVLSSGPVAWGSLGYYFHRMRITDIDTVRCWPDDTHRASDYYIVEPNGQPFDTVGTELMFRSVADVGLYRRRER